MDLSYAPPPPDEALEPPNNREAEEAVLGAVMINGESLIDITEHLTPDDFYIHRNKFIFQAMLDLLEQNTPIDIVTLISQLESNGHLKEIGGSAYVMGLINVTPSCLYAVHYAKLVREASIRRKMLFAAGDIAKLSSDKSKTLDQVLASFQDKVYDVSGSAIRGDGEPIRDVVSEVYDLVNERSQSDLTSFGVPTGLIDLDRLLGGGMQKSDLLIVAGRPGMGKTGFLLSVAVNAAKHGKKVGLFSLEMSNEQLVLRLIAMETGIDTNALRVGRLADNDWEKFIGAVESLANLPILLDDTPALTPSQLRAKCRRLMMQHGLDLVIVDYLQLMPIGEKVESRVPEISRISRELKELARTLNVPILSAAQLSRAVEQRADKKPVLSDLRESGSIEQDSDVVMFIHSPGTDEDDESEVRLTSMIVAKHRNGPVSADGIDVLFMKRLTKFVSATVSRADRSSARA